MQTAFRSGCPHCQAPVFRKSDSGDKLKLGRTPVVLHKSGDVEINCPRCRRAVIVGRLEAQQTMRKGQPRLHIRTHAQAPE